MGASLYPTPAKELDNRRSLAGGLPKVKCPICSSLHGVGHTSVAKGQGKLRRQHITRR